MQILIDHLTRMADGFICVAGLDQEGNHVRPVLAGERISSRFLAANGGPFAIGTVLDIGNTQPIGRAPEVEDHKFDPEQAKLDSAAEHDLFAALESDSELSLKDIFGQDLIRRGRGAIIPPGAGRCSLGTLALGYTPRIRVVGGKVRCVIQDPLLDELDLSLTDLRCHKVDQERWVPDKDAVESLVVSVADPKHRVFLSVGVGREWARPGESPAHWLQVNNIHVGPNEVVSGKSYSVEGIRVKYPNAYGPWTLEEEELLARMHKAGVSIEQMAGVIGRQLGGIATRLNRLGLVR